MIYLDPVGVAEVEISEARGTIRVRSLTSFFNLSCNIIANLFTPFHAPFMIGSQKLIVIV